MNTAATLRDPTDWGSTEASVLSDTLPSTPSVDNELDGIDHDPAVVCGFSVKFPEDATSADALWEMIMKRRCASTQFPADRTNPGGFHREKKRANTLPVTGGHFIKEDLSRFDAEFFSISPAEAASIDPMQRWLLEAAYLALENAGMPMESVNGTSTAVYAGCFSMDYTLQLARDPENPPPYAALGMSISMLANRLSWFFNFEGPSIGLDSACSSTAMAIDIACQALEAGSCKMAMVAGSNLANAPEFYTWMTSINFLSKDNKCHSFDHRANGYARGEGIGVVIIKKLSQALRDGNTIRAVIRSTGSNQDGRTPGITQPSRSAQERLIQETYRKAGLSMAYTRFFEAHGTGTPIGDPREANAIGGAFQKYRSVEEPLYVGALKSNIGHLEGVSGLAGLVKSVMALEKGIIPPNTNFEKVNPRIDADYLKIKFPQEAIPWPTNGIRRASVNSFGYGGANSHIVLDDAYSYLSSRGLQGRHKTAIRPPSTVHDDLESAIPASASSGGDTMPKLLVFSTADKNGKERVMPEYQSWFNDAKVSKEIRASADYLGDLAYTLDTHRSRLPWRWSAVVWSTDDLQDIESRASSVVRVGTQSPRIGFVFSGQGAQWPAMGRELLGYTSYKEELDQAETYLKSLGCQWSVTEELLKPPNESKINDAELSQTLCTVLQVGLVNLLHRFGIEPSGVVGHSSGEISAAYAAGHLSRESAWKVAYYRGLYSSELAKLSADPSQITGAMMSVSLSEADARELISPYSGDEGGFGVSLACVNSPTNVTLAGEEPLIDHLRELLDSRKIFARKLKVPVAYHSKQMEANSAKYVEMIGSLEAPSGRRKIPMISSVFGKHVSGEQLLDPSYWSLNMVSTVQFSPAIATMCAKSEVVKSIDGSHVHTCVVDHLLEIGPHAVLQAPIRDILNAGPRGKSVKYSSALRRNQPATTTLLSVLGELHAKGSPLNLRAVNEPDGARGETLSRRFLVQLPSYPFNHSQKHWHESRLSRNYRLRPTAPSELLGFRTRDWNPADARWHHFIRLSEMPWVEGHVVNDTILYPAAGMLAMVIEAAKDLADDSSRIDGYTLSDVEIQAPMDLTSSSGVLEIQTALKVARASRGTDVAYEFSVRTYHQANDSWVVNCNGFISMERKDDLDSWQTRKAEKERAFIASKLSQTISRCETPVSSKDMYGFLENSNYKYGPSFQNAQNQFCWDKTKEASSEVSLFSSSTEDHVIHPASFDSMLHICFTALTAGGSRPMATSVITGFKRIWVANQGICAPAQTVAKACVSITKSTRSGFSCDGGALVGPSNEVKMLYEGMGLTNVTSVPLSDADRASRPDPHMFAMGIDLKVALNKLEPNEVASYIKSKVPQHMPEQEANVAKDELRLFLLVALERAAAMNEDGAWKRHLREWVEGQLAEARKDPSWSDPDSLIHRIREDFDGYSKHLAAGNAVEQTYSELAAQLPSILRGEVELGSLQSHKGLLTQSLRDQASKGDSDQLAAYVDLLAHQTPGMRILEIRSGGESTTQSLLAALASSTKDSAGSLRCDQLDIADVSSDLLDRNTSSDGSASQNAQVKFGSINLQGDLEDQGYSLSAYDLVVISFSSLIWSTSHIQDSLKHVHQLVNPSGTSGKVILHQLTYLQSWEAAFISGLLSSTEATPGAFPSPSYGNVTWWDAKMAEAGFGDLVLNLSDDRNGSLSGTPSILVYSAKEQETLSTIPEAKAVQQVTVVTNAGVIPQGQLAHDLIANLQETSGWDLQISSLQDLIAQTERESGGLVLMLLDYDPSSFLGSLDESAWAQVQSLFQTSHRILWVSAGGGTESSPEHGILDGFARTMRSEYYQLHLVTLALDVASKSATRHASHVYKVAREMVQRQSNESYEEEYIEIDGLLHTRRLFEAKAVKDDMDSQLMQYHPSSSPAGHVPFEMSTSDIPGLPQEPRYLRVAELLDTDMAPDEVDIEVRAATLHAEDQSVAGEGVAANSGFRGYATGVVVRAGVQSGFSQGDQVVVTRSEAFSSHMRVPSRSVARLPTGADLSSSCAVVKASVAAYNALIDVARMRPGNCVMIQDGASPIGLASLQLLSRHSVSDVWTTASNEQEAERIPTTLLSEERILPQSWFDGQGASMLASRWAGKFDIVFIPYADASTPLHTERVRAGGRCIALYKDSGDRHSLQQVRGAPSNILLSFLHADSEVPMRSSLQFAASTLLSHDPQNQQQHNVWHFPASSIASACKRLRTASDKDVVVVDIDSSDTIETFSPAPSKLYFGADGTYLVAGGLGGLGRSLSRWLVSRGARNLILLSRSGPRTPEAQELLSELRAKDVHVEAPPCDITDRDALRAMLDRHSQIMPPVKGCIQASMVMTERVFDKMDFKDWKTTVDPKVKGSWNLHLELPSGLDFFILTSSIMGILGTGSLSAYNAGNTYEDALARYRVLHGERATALDLGGIPDAGYLAEASGPQNRDINSVLRSDKYVHTYVKDVCALLDMACDPARAHSNDEKARSRVDIGSDTIYCQPIVGLRPISHWKHLEYVPATMCQPFWGHMHHFPVDESAAGGTQAKQQTSAANVMDRIAAAAGNLAQVAEVVSEALANRVASLLGFTEDAVDLQEPMHLYGLDSLTAIDVRNWMGTVFDVDMPIFEILGGATFADAGTSVAQKLQSKQS